MSQGLKDYKKQNKKKKKKQNTNIRLKKKSKDSFFSEKYKPKVFKDKKLKEHEKDIERNIQKHDFLHMFESSFLLERLNNMPCRDADKHMQLTKLQQKMKLKLLGGKFRMINEHLYNITGKEALNFFRKHPELYEEYHTGFQNQILSWPENPVDLMIEKLNLYIQKSRKDVFKVADLGCGDAKIAKVMKNISNIEIYSCDLVSLDPSVIACDMSSLPFNTSTIDVAIFCLSLMGTNYIDFLKEAWRILKMNGKLWIAEVKSRFTDNEGTAFCTALTSLGFSLVETDISNKMFMCLYFEKTHKVNDKKDYGILLKSCVYKRR